MSTEKRIKAMFVVEFEESDYAISHFLEHAYAFKFVTHIEVKPDPESFVRRAIEKLTDVAEELKGIKDEKQNPGA